jgi:hypothetical protein
MKLYGQEVPQSVIDAANAAMVGRFTPQEINKAICRTGFIRGYGDIADRLLQRARKAGKIRYEGGYWHQVVK